jgi:hypothetical protein
VPGRQWPRRQDSWDCGRGLHCCLPFCVLRAKPFLAIALVSFLLSHARLCGLNQSMDHHHGLRLVISRQAVRPMRPIDGPAQSRLGCDRRIFAVKGRRNEDMMCQEHKVPVMRKPTVFQVSH